jgi:hypothetical protein
MPRSAVGWIFLAGWLVACSSGGGSDGGKEGSAAADPSREASDVDPARDVRGADGVEVRYQFVDTPGGMTIEAVSDGEVQSLSCPTRTCAGYCDECAARACQAAGELAEACVRLVRDCSDSCTCAAIDGEGPGNSCGFPVCTTNRNLCYIGSGDPSTSDPTLPPDPAPDPAPDTDPTTPASRPSSASSSSPSSGSSAARPAE